MRQVKNTYESTVFTAGKKKQSYTLKLRIFWDVLPCSQLNVDRHFRGVCCLHHQGALIMEAARTSETLVDIQLRTWQYIPEDSEHHTRRRENFKSHNLIPCSACFTKEKQVPHIYMFVNVL
jgi:hypothetical protein